MKKKNNFKEIEKLLPKAYRPISAWGYFWRVVLYSIPVIGWIFLIVHAISGKNRNGRNFARSFFCGLLIAVIVAVVATVAFYVCVKLGLVDAARTFQLWKDMGWKVINSVAAII